MLPICDDLRTASQGCDRLVGVAIHEAGHLVAARHFGRKIKAVAIDDHEGFGCLQLWPRRSTAEEVRQTLVLLAAGEAAASQCRRRPAQNDGDDDKRQTTEEARRLLGLLASQAACDAEIATARRRAEKLIETRWADVLAIASQLLRFQAATNEVPTGNLDDLD